MKRFFIITLTLFTCIAVFAAGSDDKFINALRNCSAYRESGTVNIQGINALSTKIISGWQGDKCVYKENMNISGINTGVTCNFSKPQIDEITRVADAYLLTLKYSGEEPDASSLDNIQNNPLTNVFNKYLQDPSVCSINGIQ